MHEIRPFRHPLAGCEDDDFRFPGDSRQASKQGLNLKKFFINNGTSALFITEPYATVNIVHITTLRMECTIVRTRVSKYEMDI